MSLLDKYLWKFSLSDFILLSNRAGKCLTRSHLIPGAKAGAKIGALPGARVDAFTDGLENVLTGYLVYYLAGF